MAQKAETYIDKSGNSWLVFYDKDRDPDWNTWTTNRLSAGHLIVMVLVKNVNVKKIQMKKIENQLQVVHTEKNVFGKL